MHFNLFLHLVLVNNSYSVFCKQYFDNVKTDSRNGNAEGLLSWSLSGSHMLTLAPLIFPHIITSQVSLIVFYQEASFFINRIFIFLSQRFI